VLDVHGESESTWPASDALCAALQVINHLQDCAQDYANLDRVYLPLDSIRRAGAELTALKNDRASPALLACIRELAQRTDLLLDKAAELPRQVRDLRLRMEIAVIVRLARVLTRKLLSRDPLSQETHASKLEFLGWSLVGMCEGLAVRGPTSPVQSSSARGA
jgi:phytoene/squalene synthetase